MRKVDKSEVEAALEEIGFLLELSGENPFKTRAYQGAARSLRALETDLEETVRSGDLRKIKGIGPAIAEKITTLVTTGRLPYLEELRGNFPPTLLEITRVPGLGPKRVATLWKELRIASLDSLEAACREGKLAGLPGFGPKVQANALAGIQRARAWRERFLTCVVAEEAEPVLAALRAHPAVLRASLAGSLRRRMETAKDADIVAAVKPGKGEEVGRYLTELPGIAGIVGHGDTKTSVRLEGGPSLDLRCVADEEYPTALLYFTGSKAHNVAMRGRAQKLGFKLNEYGLWKGEERVPCASEEEVFRALGLAWIPPELREDQGEIERAEEGEFPPLLEESDLRGVLHCHTTWSDGTASIAEMAEAARRAGFSYLGISDHSVSASYAGGLPPERLRAQREEIDAWNRAHGGSGFRLLAGSEVDIRDDGTLDYPDDVLASLDFVVASVHSKFRLAKEEQTARILKALANPRVDILGHPTGRLLLEREPYEVDMHEVLREAGKREVVVETNAHPYRLDLDWRLGAFARSCGVMTSINPDAHSTEEMDMRWGVGTARKGGFGKGEVLNALPAEEVLRRTRARRG